MEIYSIVRTKLAGAPTNVIKAVEQVYKVMLGISEVLRKIVARIITIQTK